MILDITFPWIDRLQLAISFSNDAILGIEFRSFKPGQETDSGPGSNTILSESEMDSEHANFAKKIKQEFANYFLAPEQHGFALPCRLELGTPYQQNVWQALLQIPAGQVKSYGKLAKELKSSPRAVGNACRNNLFPVLVPCHRVVSATGIGGYAGDTPKTQKGTINYLQIKQCLLAHEKAAIK